MTADKPKAQFRAVELPEFTEHFFPINIVLCRTDAEWADLSKYTADRFSLPVRPTRPDHIASATLAEAEHGYSLVIVSVRADIMASCNADERVAVLAHECVHVAQFVARCIGSRLGIEPEAYFVSALLLWVLRETDDAPDYAGADRVLRAVATWLAMGTAARRAGWLGQGTPSTPAPSWFGRAH